jgi:hypothetical protein
MQQAAFGPPSAPYSQQYGHSAYGTEYGASAYGPGASQPYEPQAQEPAAVSEPSVQSVYGALQPYQQQFLPFSGNRQPFGNLSDILGQALSHGDASQGSYGVTAEQATGDDVQGRGRESLASDPAEAQQTVQPVQPSVQERQRSSRRSQAKAAVRNFFTIGRRRGR